MTPAASCELGSRMTTKKGAPIGTGAPFLIQWSQSSQIGLLSKNPCLPFLGLW